MTDYTNFLSIVNGSATVAERWAEAVQKVVGIAQAAGVSLDEASALECTSARMYALGADVSADELEAEICHLGPMIDARKEEAELKKIADGNPAAIERLNRLPPAERISAARRAKAGTSERAEDSMELTEAQKFEIVLKVDSPIARLRLADKLGIGRSPLSNNNGR